MASRLNTPSNSVGFCLLPSELIQNILFNLALPEIIGLKLVNKSLAHIISDHNFIHECNLRSKSASWLFLCKKRWSKEATIQGFTDQSQKWFKIAINKLLIPLISPGDLYFLTAYGNVFLFASNTVNMEVIAINIISKEVRRLPPSPLGPRGTSSWRRSGMKLVAGESRPDHFRFLFVELVENRPTLFVYSSENDKWESIEVEENLINLENIGEEDMDCIFLNLIYGPSVNIVIAVNLKNLKPFILRPRFAPGENQGQDLRVGFNWVNQIDQLHVYGDGYMIIARSKGCSAIHKRGRMLGSIELWGLTKNGLQWRFVSKVPSIMMGEIEKPYEVLMGCLEVRQGIIRTALVSFYEGQWDITWLSYVVGKCHWDHVVLPECKMKGWNMAGIAFNHGFSIS